jgi:hypothetical protein
MHLLLGFSGCIPKVCDVYALSLQACGHRAPIQFHRAPNIFLPDRPNPVGRIATGIVAFYPDSRELVGAKL